MSSSVEHHLALIAPEFPPDLGGMAELARGLALALCEHARVSVHTFSHRQPVDDQPYQLDPCLSGSPARDFLHLRNIRPTAWLCLNAGYVPALARLDEPGFAYLHGNDFLNPWIACGPAWFEAIRRPYMADLRHALRRASLKAHLPQIERIFVNSQNTAKLVAERMGVASSRIGIHPPGVGKAFFQEPGEVSNGTLRLLTVSRLTQHTARKNVDGVLHALGSIHLPFHYTVVGDGDDRPRLEGLAAELGLEEQVTFRGSLRLPELLDAYRESDLFILVPKATRKDVEGFGIVYIEASASGVPVLGSREGGAVDAIREGINGLLIPTSSPSDIAAGIERFARERTAFTATKIRRFAESFRWPQIASDLYRDLSSHLETVPREGRS